MRNRSSPAAVVLSRTTPPLPCREMPSWDSAKEPTNPPFEVNVVSPQVRVVGVRVTSVVSLPRATVSGPTQSRTRGGEVSLAGASKAWAKSKTTCGAPPTIKEPVPPALSKSKVKEEPVKVDVPNARTPVPSTLTSERTSSPLGNRVPRRINSLLESVAASVSTTVSVALPVIWRRNGTGSVLALRSVSPKPRTSMVSPDRR